MITAKLETAEQLLARGAALEAHAELVPLTAKLGALDPPSAYRLLRSLAAAAQRLGRLQEADRWLDQAAPFAVDPVVRVDLSIARMANALARGREVEVVDFALDALPAAEGAELTLRKAEVLMSYGHVGALACFERAAKLAASAGDATLEAAAVLGAARVHAGEKGYGRAEAMLRDVLTRAPVELAAELWLTLGDVKFEQGDVAAAEASYRSAPSEAAALRLAALHVRGGKLAEAEAEYLVGLAALPQRDAASAAVLDELASLYGRMGRFDEARAALEKAVSWVQVAVPADPMLEAHLRARLGALLLSQQQFGAAVVELQLAVAHHPLAVDVLNTLAVAQLQAGTLAAAQASATRALELAEEGAASALALNTLGMIEIAKGAAAKARTHFERSKQLFEEAGFVEEAAGVQKNLAALR